MALRFGFLRAAAILLLLPCSIARPSRFTDEGTPETSAGNGTSRGLPWYFGLVSIQESLVKSLPKRDPGRPGSSTAAPAGLPLTSSMALRASRPAEDGDRTTNVHRTAQSDGENAPRRELEQLLSGKRCKAQCEENRAMLKTVNEFRVGEGKSELCLSNKLVEAAKIHSDDMSSNGFFNHEGTDGSHVGRRINVAKFRWRSCAENIAFRFSTVRSVFGVWKKSKGHRRNILGDYTHMGVYKTGSKWTQVFAKPRGDEPCDRL